ncbi:CoA-binding protein [Candidatus Woesearchaeota archaeon]|nr:CoA-binding protein [Candidatus Woesearchaeota archaeon]
MINLDNFFKPKSIAIIGASRKKGKVGNVLVENLLHSKFKGKIYPVNPKANKILNLKCYKSVLNIKEKIDLAVLAIPAEIILKSIKECNKKEVKDILIITAGFSEIGNTKLENELKQYIEKNQIRMIGPNVLGILDFHTKLDTIFLPRTRLKRPEAGCISFVTQSGAAGSAVLDLATFEGHKFAKFISYGNATTIDETDIIEYLGNDKDTKVICLYIEGIKDGRKFMKVLKDVTKKKPVIAIKGGISEQGSKATLSHTGSLAGDYKVYSGVFKQLNIIQAENLEDMLDYAYIFESMLKPKGNRVQIITNGGGYGILTVDAISKTKNLQLAQLTEKTKNYLKKQFPKTVTVNNPIDLVGDADNKRYELAINACLQDNNVDLILLIVLYQTPLLTFEITDLLAKEIHKSKKPIVIVSTGGEIINKFKKVLEEKGIVTYTFPHEAVKALSALVEYYF